MYGHHAHRGGVSLVTPSDYAVIVVIGAVTAATIGVWLTGQLAALLFNHTWPPVGLADAFTAALALPANLADPRNAWPATIRTDLPGPVAFYTTASLVVAIQTAAFVVAMRQIGRRRQIRGFASRTQLAASLTHRAVLRRASQLRPGLGRKAAITDVAVDLGRAVGSRTRLAASIENSVLLLAAPRQGKTSQIIIPWLHTWPGPAVVTSVRTDVIETTLTLREVGGPVAVMDLSGATWPQPLRWSPLSGCHRFDKARNRADIMVQVGKTTSNDSTNAGFFGLTATNLLAGWLHTAAISDRNMADVLRWGLDETDDEPVKLLANHTGGHRLVASMMDTIYASPTETRSNMWATALTAIAPLLTTAAHDTFCPPTTESFDIPAFLGRRGTVYLTVTEQQAGDLSPLVSAFVDEIVEVAKRIADRSPHGRLDPPLGLILDEVANVVPLPNLPQLMSYGGGSGIFVTAVLQDMAQARHRWGLDRAAMLWGSSTVKIALGGLGGNELEDLSRLAGEYTDRWISPQHSPHGTTYAVSERDRRTIAPAQVRTLSERRREALVIHATTPPVKTTMVRHYEGPHAATYAAATKHTHASRTAADHADAAPDADERSW